MKFRQFIESLILEGANLDLLSEIKDTKRNRAELRRVYGDIPDEDIGDIFSRFNSQQARLSNKDIFKYKDLDELKGVINDMSNNTKKGRSEGGKIKFPEKPFGNAKHLYVDDEVLVVEINSEQESIHYGHEVGKECSWCISYKGRPNYWKDYHEGRGVNFIFVIGSDGNKWALSYKPNSDYLEVYNVADNIRSPLEFIVKYPQIVKPLKANGVNVKDMKDYDRVDDGKGYVIKDTKMTTFLTYDNELRDGIRDNHPAYAIG